MEKICLGVETLFLPHPRGLTEEIVVLQNNEPLVHFLLESAIGRNAWALGLQRLSDFAVHDLKKRNLSSASLKSGTGAPSFNLAS